MNDTKGSDNTHSQIDAQKLAAQLVEAWQEQLEAWFAAKPGSVLFDLLAQLPPKWPDVATGQSEEQSNVASAGLGNSTLPHATAMHADCVQPDHDRAQRSELAARLDALERRINRLEQTAGQPVDPGNSKPSPRP